MNLLNSFLQYNNKLFTGGMDIIVIKQPSGSFLCSPLKLGFNFKVLKAKDKKVDTFVNGREIRGIPIFLKEDGNAYIEIEHKTKKREKKNKKLKDINNSLKCDSKIFHRKSSHIEKLKLNLNEAKNEYKNEYINIYKDENVYKNEYNENFSRDLAEKITEDIKYNNNINIDDNIDNINIDNNNINNTSTNLSPEYSDLSYNTENNNKDNIGRIYKKRFKSQCINNENEKILNINEPYKSTQSGSLCPEYSEEKSKKIYSNSENEYESNNSSYGVEEFSLQMSDCWNTITKYKDNKNFLLNYEFSSHIISYEEFIKDPWKHLNSQNLAFRFRNKILTWKVAAPLLVSLAAYGRPLPENLMEKLATSEDGYFFFWRKINKGAGKIDLDLDINCGSKSERYNKNEKKRDLSGERAINRPLYKSSIIPERSKTPLCRKFKIKKNFFLKTKSKQIVESIPSKYIAKMDLKEGKNDIVFQCGTVKVSLNIYLWSYNDKIIISDFDGTVTRSDFIGQISTLIGIDWTHKSIAKLYQSIAKNGYKILYVTARPMCQYESTKKAIHGVNQNGITMPEGPLLMSKEGYATAVLTEIINRIPEISKINVLLRLRAAFPNGVNPFYAGFGNKISDRESYLEAGVPPGRIYIINEKGDIYTDLSNYITNFSQINEDIDVLFPFIGDQGYNSMIYSHDVLYKFKEDPANILDKDEIEQEIKDLLK